MSASVYYIIAVLSIANCVLSANPPPLNLPRWSDFCVHANKEIRDIEETCLKKFGLTQPETYAYARKGAKEQGDIRCLENCIYEGFGIFKPNHALDDVKAKQVLPDYSYDCLDKCKAYMNDDHCKQSYCLSQCVHGCMIDDQRFYKSFC